MSKTFRERIRWLKNGSILVLAILAVCQTGWLWFGSNSSHNFFSMYYPSLFGAVSTEANNDFTRPYRIISGAGDGRFDIRYGNLANVDTLAYGDALLSALLKNGEYGGSEPVDYALLLNKPVYLFEYAFPLPADVYARAYGQRSNLFTSRGAHTISAVVLQPPTDEDDAAYAYLIDGETMYRYSIGKTGRLDASLYTDIPTVDAGDGKIWYVSAALEKMTDVAPGQFIAQWGEEGLRYAPVTLTNPYANVYGEKLISNIQSCVEPLFDNPASINAALGADGVYTFYNAFTVVRFTIHDTLEYASYRAIDSSGAASFTVDYAAAVAFIGADAYVVNETYLAGYAEENDINIFWFDYVINDMPLVLPEGWPTQSDSGHAIEVSVDHGVVVKYRKLAYNFHIDENDSMTGRLAFDVMMDNLTLPETDVEIPRLEQVLLGYRIDNLPSLSLYWFIDGSGEKRIKSIGM